MRRGLLSAVAFIAAMMPPPGAEPTRPTIPLAPTTPHLIDALPLPFRDVEKIRAAKEKRARRAAKRRKP